MQTSAYDIALRFVGLVEAGGSVSNPQVLAMLRLDAAWPSDDEVPWCSAFVNYVCWLLRMPRSKSLLARSWLHIGIPIPLSEANVGDVVILRREDGPGADDWDAPGHVGFFSALEGQRVWLLGGNQSNRVSIVPFSSDLVIGVRRLM